MFNFLKESTTKSSAEKAMETALESRAILSIFTSMVDRLKDLNSRIEEDKKEAVAKRNSLQDTIQDLDAQQQANQKVISKIESILS